MDLAHSPDCASAWRWRKGWRWRRHLPLVGIPTLDFLAAAQPHAEYASGGRLRAGRGRLAVGWYRLKTRAWQPSRRGRSLTLEELANGSPNPPSSVESCPRKIASFLVRIRPNIRLASPAGSLRHPSFLAELAWKRWKAGQVDNPATLSPIYLHYNDPIPG